MQANSLTELYAGYGRNIYTALGSVNGQAVGIVATAKGYPVPQVHR